MGKIMWEREKLMYLVTESEGSIQIILPLPKVMCQFHSTSHHHNIFP